MPSPQAPPRARPAAPPSRWLSLFARHTRCPARGSPFPPPFAPPKVAPSFFPESREGLALLWSIFLIKIQKFFIETCPPFSPGNISAQAREKTFCPPHIQIHTLLEKSGGRATFIFATRACLTEKTPAGSWILLQFFVQDILIKRSASRRPAFTVLFTIDFQILAQGVIGEPARMGRRWLPYHIPAPLRLKSFQHCKTPFSTYCHSAQPHLRLHWAFICRSGYGGGRFVGGRGFGGKNLRVLDFQIPQRSNHRQKHRRHGLTE